MKTTEMQKQAAFAGGFQFRLQELAAEELLQKRASAPAALLEAGAAAVPKAGFGWGKALGIGATGLGPGAAGARGIDQHIEGKKQQTMAGLSLADRLRAALSLIAHPKETAEKVYPGHFMPQ